MVPPSLLTPGTLVSASRLVLGLTLVPTYLKLVKFVSIVPYFGQQVEATFSSLLSFQILSFFIFLLYFALSVGIGAYYVLGYATLQFH